MINANFPIPTVLTLWSDGGFSSTLGGDGPAVSGSVASLVANSSATVVFDLGPEWANFSETMVIVQPGATLTAANITIQHSLDGTSALVYAGIRYAAGLLACVTTVAHTITASVIVSTATRFLRVTVASGSGNAYAASGKIFAISK